MIPFSGLYQIIPTEQPMRRSQTVFFGIDHSVDSPGFPGVPLGCPWFPQGSPGLPRELLEARRGSLGLPGAPWGSLGLPGAPQDPSPPRHKNPPHQPRICSLGPCNFSPEFFARAQPARLPERKLLLNNHDKCRGKFGACVSYHRICV